MSVHRRVLKNSVHCEEFTESPSNKQGNRIFRKIRKSTDLHCFESSDEENNISSCNFNFSGTKIKKTSYRQKNKSQEAQNCIEQNAVSFDNDKCFSIKTNSLRKQSALLKQRNQNTNVKKSRLTSSLSIKGNEEIGIQENFTSDDIQEETCTFDSYNQNFERSMDNELKKRRIVKAKRILSNQKHEQQQHKEAPAEEIVKNNNITVTVTEVASTVDEELSSRNNATSQRKKSTNELIIDALPSPISPSQSNAEGNNSTSSMHGQLLIFNSSKEDLLPSKRGAVESSNKRRTYELEDSVNDISLLKATSRQSCITIDSSSSYKESFQLSNETPTEVNFSKITTRRRWNKVNTGSPLTRNYSPSWINPQSTKRMNMKSPLISKEKSPKSFKTYTPKLSTSSSSSKRKYSSKVKMPNFAAIHQRALEKVENITDYKQRKEERAMMLLSGKRPTASQQTREFAKKENRKQLRFAADTSFKKHSPTFIPLPSTPLPKRNLKETTESPESNEHPETFKLRAPEIISSVGIASKGNSVQSPSSLKRQAAHKSKLAEVFLLTQKIMAENKLKMKANGVNNLFNAPLTTSSKTVKNFAKQQNINKAAVATKSNPKTNTIESRRYAIKGVRSNRRFELLMNMRKGV